jgi:hypothetical protein
MEQKKKEGNEQYKAKNFEMAMELYLFALCGCDFKKRCTPE